jgi:hypothetical protein
MSTLTLAPVTVIFTGATMNDVYEQITQYVAKNAVKHLDSHTETVIPGPAPLPPRVANIPTIPIHHYVPAPAPLSAEERKDLLIADLKNIVKTTQNQLYIDEWERIINTINGISNPLYFNPYITLISNKKYDVIYDCLFDSIRKIYYEYYEPHATQKEKDRKVAILAALQEKYDSYPPEKTFQREAYGAAIRDINQLPSSTDMLIYGNLEGVGKSISKVISDVYNKYK